MLFLIVRRTGIDLHLYRASRAVAAPREGGVGPGLSTGRGRAEDTEERERKERERKAKHSRTPSVRETPGGNEQHGNEKTRDEIGLLSIDTNRGLILTSESAFSPRAGASLGWRNVDLNAESTSPYLPEKDSGP